MKSKAIATIALMLGLVVGAEAVYQVRLRIVQTAQAQGGGLTSGDVVIRFSGSCGTGFTEVTAADGKMIRGTIASNADVGDTGGNDAITPAGTVSQPTFAGDA